MIIIISIIKPIHVQKRYKIIYINITSNMSLWWRNSFILIHIMVRFHYSRKYTGAENLPEQKIFRSGIFSAIVETHHNMWFYIKNYGICDMNEKQWNYATKRDM